MDWWTFGGADASAASTWFGLRHAGLNIVVLQPTVVSRFGCFVFEFWVLRFRVLRFGNYFNKAAPCRMDTLICHIDPPAKHDGLLCRFCFWFWLLVLVVVF